MTASVNDSGTAGPTAGVESASAVFRISARSSVDCDPLRNEVRLVFRGHVDRSEMDALAQEVTRLLPRLRVGFSMLVDLSPLGRMDTEVVPALAAMMDALREACVGQVVRVVPDARKDIGLNILSIIHYRGQVPVRTVGTVAEAEQVLDRSQPQSTSE